MGHSFVETDQPLVWNKEGKLHSLDEAKRLINKTCLEYIRREYEDKEQEYEWEGDDFWNYASLGDKDGVIVSYFPQLSNEEIKKLSNIVYRMDSKEKLNIWLNASGNWIKPYLHERNVKSMPLVGRNPKFEKLVKFYKNSSELPTTKRGVNYGAKVIVDDTEPLTMPPKYGKLFEEINRLLSPKVNDWNTLNEMIKGQAYTKAWRSNNIEALAKNNQSPRDFYILEKSDDNKDFWSKLKISFENIKKMHDVLHESYGPALAIANDEIVWMGGFSREG